jgi:hypothetical protein
MVLVTGLSTFTAADGLFWSITRSMEGRRCDSTGATTITLATEIKPIETFYPAEEYHQDYVTKHPDDPYVRHVSQPRFQRVNLPAILGTPDR